MDKHASDNWYRGADAKAINAHFFTKIASPEGVAEIGMGATTYVRDRLRELAIVRKLLVVEYVHPDDLERDENTEFFKKIVDLEPDSTALSISIRGDAPGRYVHGDRVAMFFGRITSPRFAKKVTELMSYEAPITKIIEDNTIRDIQEIEDYKWFSAVEQGVLGKAAGSHRAHFQDTWEDTSLRTRVDRITITDTAALLAANERRAATLVMSQADVMKFSGQDAAIVGDDLASKVTIEGWEYADLFGLRLIASIKSVSRRGKTFADGAGVPADQVALTRQGLAPLDLGRFFIFDEPDRLGKFYSLEEANFHIKQEWGLVEWQQDELIAMGLVNIGSVAICDLRLKTPDTGTWLPSKNVGGSQLYNVDLIA